ncbi:MAG: VCBS repeat-containing protein [Bradymonadales bacterium]|jgi:hypothetical protein
MHKHVITHCISIFFILSLGSLFFGCEDEISGRVIPIDPKPCVGDNCPCVGDECDVHELCRNNSLDDGEECDIVDGIVTFRETKACSDYVENSVGALHCASDCSVDYSQCRQKELPTDCKADYVDCTVEAVNGKQVNIALTCEGGKVVKTICEGSCSEGSCVACEYWDPICYTPKCDYETQLECADTCCEKDTHFCDFAGSGACCSYDEVCGQHCCKTGEVCENAVCRKECKYTRCLNADNVEVCCENEGEICASNQCYLPTTSCIDIYDCEFGEYCETLTHQCLPQPTTEPACLRKPTGGEVKPTELWFWGEGEIADDQMPGHYKVMMAPVVADLDGDGNIEVVVNTWAGGNYVSDGVLRIINGVDGSLKHSILDPSLRTIGGAQIALGDLDGDGKLEIVTCESGSNQLIAFKQDGSLYWRTDLRINGVQQKFCSQSGMGIADFDGDGKPEVYVRYLVFAGQPEGDTKIAPLKWGALDKSQLNLHMGGHAHCDYTVAADLDEDGHPELVGGNIAYKFTFDGSGSLDASPLYDRSDEHPDGYPSIGDLNLDAKPEVVVVRSDPSPWVSAGHSLMVFNADGSNYWSAPVDNNGTLCVVSEGCGGGGPATIANVNHTPEPEITLATAFTYAVFNADGTIWWQKPTKDRSSRKTGSSVFDFDGDGIAEIVYNDEWFLRIYSGQETAPDKGVVFCQCNPSATHWEYPVIADINNDGAAEIVVGSTRGDCPTTHDLNEENGLDNCTSQITTNSQEVIKVGLRAFAAPNKDWVGTRKIWNQHAYSITNVRDDGTIPKKARPNWKVPGLNNFRLNVEPGATNLPDLKVDKVSSDTYFCDNSVTLLFEIHNTGWAAAPAGVPVTIYIINGEGQKTKIGEVHTKNDILPGQFEPISFEYTRSETQAQSLDFLIVVNPIDTVDSLVTECDAANNEGSYKYKCVPKVN